MIPHKKRRRSGSIIAVTSARELRPEPGFSVPTTARAGTTAFALALTRGLAPWAIQVNAIASDYLYSELYQPRATFIDDPAGQQMIKEAVPLGRLGPRRSLGPS